MATFEAHGSPAVEIQKHLLVLDVQHPINEEGMQLLLRRVTNAAVGFEGGKWNVLALVSGEVLLTPEAERLLRNKLPALISSGHEAIAVVINDQSVRWSLERQLQRIHSQSASPVRAFESEADARGWLSQLGRGSS